MSDVPSFLQEQPVAEEVAVAAEPVIAAPTGEPDPAPAPPAVAPQEDKSVPLPALLDERDKRKAAEAELERLRQWKAEQEARAAQPAPEFFSDPERWQQHLQTQVEQRVMNERLNTSEELARDKWGDEAVDKATDAFKAAVQQSPALYAEMARHRHPYKYVVEWHKKQELLSRVGADPDAWIEAEVQRRLAERAPPPVQQVTQPAPPRSLAAAPSAGANRAPVKSGWEQLFGQG